MKNRYNLLYLLLTLSGWTLSASAQSTTFNYIGSVQTYTVPGGVTCVNVDASGAAGGQNSDVSTGPPYVIDSEGHGARVQATLTVVPGQVLDIFVGGAGVTGVLFSSAAGGYNGGGASSFDPLSTIAGNAGGGGGGESDIQVPPYGLANRVIVAAGGGGAGANWGSTFPPPLGVYNYDKGGDGGGTTGEDGWDDDIVGGAAAGLGGTPGGGGAGGTTYGLAGAGGSGFGGDAAGATAGGGGGGGYWGGGGGSYAGGGGGSSYSDAILATGVIHTRGYNTGDGVVIIGPTPAPAAGAIAGPATGCVAQSATYTNPTAGAGVITWSSSAPGVATIGSATGITTGISPGVFTIICMVTTPCGSSSATMTVTINPSPLPITGADSVCALSTTTLSDIIPSGTWSSVSPGVGTIDPVSGIFYGVAAGTTTVSYTVAGCPATTIVTVDPNPGPISGPGVVCGTGGMVTLSNTLTGGTWSSYNPAVGTIDPVTGVVTGIAFGTTDISYSSVSGCTVGTVETVNPIPSAITGPGSLCDTNTIMLMDPTPGGTWSSTILAVGTIDPALGIFYGAGAGTTTVSYTVGGCPATTVVTVNANPGSIIGPDVICGVGSAVTLTNVLPGGIWSSTVMVVATVGSSSGVVTGMAFGATTISYSVAGCAVDTVINVNPRPAPITGPGTLCNTGVYSITLMDMTPGGTWSSFNPPVASIDASGDVSGNAVGTALISYTLAGCTSTTVLTVNANPAAISGPDTICNYGNATYTDATAGGTWSSLAPMIATIGSSSGIATADDVSPPFPGTTVIVYTAPDGCNSQLVVKVIDTTDAIMGSNSVCIGNAIALFDSTFDGTWTSSSLSAPVVGSVLATEVSGTVTGLAVGVYTIYYSRNFCPVKTHVVTVNPLPAIITGPTAVCVGLTTTLADATPGGAWSSSNPLVGVTPAGMVTSAVTGLSATITYTLPTSCFVTVMVNVGTPPTPITFLKDTVCQGVSTTLSNATPGGVWSSTSLAIAPVVATTGVVTGVSGGSVTISYTLPGGCFATQPFTVNPSITPVVTVTGPVSPVCAGTPDTFIAHPTNAGAATYRWAKFTTIPFASTTDTLIDTPIHGDVVMVYMTAHGVCSVPDSAVDTFAIDVYPDSVFPVITITTAGPDTISIIGETKTFYSSVTYAGTTPGYQWIVNGVPFPGATSSSFSLQVYANDTVYCQVTGTPLCPASVLVPGISNAIIINAAYLGVSNLSQGAANLSLFPNPNSGSFTLSGTVNNVQGQEVYYDVSNMLGQVVYRGTTVPQNGRVNEQVTLGNVAAGTYLLRVNTDKGSETFHFVISK